MARQEKLAGLLIEKISEAFKDVRNWSQKQQRSNKYWNEQLIKVIEKIGNDFGYEYRFSKTEGDRNWEFLYDMSLLNTGKTEIGDGFFKEPFYLKSIEIALECEWALNVDEILYDFTKLLVTKAPLKMFVFFQFSTNKVENVLQKIINAIDCFQQRIKEERYLLCAYDWEHKKFRFCLIDTDGRILRQ